VSIELVELVELARLGDQDAFASLAARNVDRCYALAFRILRDAQRAQDATQDAMLGAWRDLPSLRDPDRFDAWLTRLVVHAAYVQARTDRRWAAHVRLIAPVREPGPDPAVSIVERDALDRGFRQLTPEQRAVLVLHHGLGYPLAEIADVLGIPAGTARSRLHHATRHMRTSLEADLEAARPAKEQTA
jgi:RNA polymerase sigma-70 factor (ECF subfamily)